MPRCDGHDCVMRKIALEMNGDSGFQIPRFYQSNFLKTSN